MMLEAREHPYAAFVTLTFNQQHVPKDGSVRKRDVQLFLKRVRFAIAPRKLRYYAVGEYGEQSWRPHYHLILYNISPTEEKLLKTCWPFGFIQIGTAEPRSMKYTCGYLLKKMTKATDRRLQGRQPEFAMMSTRPGLGHGCVTRMYESYKTRQGLAALENTGWISEQLRMDGTVYPLAPYLKKKLIQKLEIPEELVKEHSFLKHLETYAKEVGQTHKESDTLRKSRTTAQEGKYKNYRKGYL